MEGSLRIPGLGRRREGFSDCLSLTKLSTCMNVYIKGELAAIKEATGITFNTVSVNAGFDREAKKIELSAEIDLSLNLATLLESTVKAVCSCA